jgi:hypothetical protein
MAVCNSSIPSKSCSACNFFVIEVPPRFPEVPSFLGSGKDFAFHQLHVVYGPKDDQVELPFFITKLLVINISF